MTIRVPNPVLVALAALILLGGGIAVGLLIGAGDEEGAAPVPAHEAMGPRPVAEPELASFASSVGQPIYWAGGQNGAELEFMKTEAGTFVRYLTGGAQVGDRRQAFLTVATYPARDAFVDLKEFGDESGAKARAVHGGGIAVTTGPGRSDVHLAYPGHDFHIEVYDPEPGRALDLATSGAIQPAR